MGFCISPPPSPPPQALWGRAPPPVHSQKGNTCPPASSPASLPQDGRGARPPSPAPPLAGPRAPRPPTPCCLAPFRQSLPHPPPHPLLLHSRYQGKLFHSLHILTIPSSHEPIPIFPLPPPSRPVVPSASPPASPPHPPLRPALLSPFRAPPAVYPSLFIAPDFALDTSPGKEQGAVWTVGHGGLPRPIRKQKTSLN